MTTDYRILAHYVAADLNDSPSRAGGRVMTPAMNFEDALDLLIATGITCLRNSNPKLKRAIEIAISYRELDPTSPSAISLEQLDTLQRWLVRPTGRGDQ